MDAMAVTSLLGWAHQRHLEWFMRPTLSSEPLLPHPVCRCGGADCSLCCARGACRWTNGSRGGRPHHGRVGKSSATREELEEARTTHGARGRKPLEARLRLGLLLGPSFLRDAGGTTPRRWPPMPAAAHAVVRRGRLPLGATCPPAEGAVPPPPHLAEQQVLARRCSTGFLLADARDVIARGSRTRGRRLSLSAAHTDDARLGRVESAVSSRLHT